MFFYVGFIAGTALCGVASSYELLLGARIITGIFGGVIASAIMAIVADLFPLSMRGRVMGVMLTSFGAAQVLGIPAGLALSTSWGWQLPFLLIAGIGAVAGVGIAFVLRPIDAHLGLHAKQHALAHVRHTLAKGRVTTNRPPLKRGAAAAEVMRRDRYQACVLGSGLT